MATLKYVWANTTELVSLDNYVLRDGKIINKKTRKILSYRQNSRGDYRCTVYINGKKKAITVARAALATLVGPPPTPDHTADHIDRIPENNSIGNLRWVTKSDQSMNQTRPKIYKSAFIIVKDGVEKTSKEWAEELGCHHKTVLRNARNKMNSFSFKEYPDLPGEVWKIVERSDNSQGFWEVSDKLRARYTTKHASIVFDTFCLQSGYPTIGINGKIKRLHILTFEAFNPGVIVADGKVVRHLDDDKLNFAPENLAVGTSSQNGKDAHDNGRYDGMKSARRSVTSYINDVKEREFASLADAVEYLKSIGYPKADKGGISKFINTSSIRYGRRWNSL